MPANAARSAKAATPWGPSTVLERVSVAQRASDRRFSTVVELLENERGEQLVRFAYSTDGTVRRGPVTLRERDVARLVAELARRPTLASLLGLDRAGEA
jgi:hypothetical protein